MIGAEADRAEDDKEEELPAADDGYWDDVTADTLRYLHGRRGAHRRERFRATAYVVYVAALVVLVYVVPYLLAALRTPAATDPDPAAAARVAVGAVCAVLLVLVGLVRDALWRGPALIDRATAAWLLPTPVRRGPLLRPRLRRSMLVVAALGGGIGAVAAVLLRVVVGGDTGGLAISGGATGLVTAVLGIGVAGLVESSTGRAERVLRRIGSWLWLLPALPSAALVGPGPGAVRDLLESDPLNGTKRHGRSHGRGHGRSHGREQLRAAPARPADRAARR